MTHHARQSGSSLVFALILMFAVLSLGIAGLVAASSGLKLSNNFKSGTQALSSADSAVSHARKVVKETGVLNWQADIITPWNTVWGSSPKWITGYPNYTYTVVPDVPQAGSSPLGNYWFIATGKAPGQAQRRIRFLLTPNGPYSCGAIDLITPNINQPNFNGSNFVVDGRNWGWDGNGPFLVGGGDTLGISTRTQADANTIIEVASPSPGVEQRDQLLGVGGDPSGSPPVASVGPCYGPDPQRLQTMIDTILAQPRPADLSTRRINGNEQEAYGTPDAPQITHITGDLDVQANGNAAGAGILIIDGSLTVTGNFDFYGLVIVRGSTTLDTDLSGNTAVIGALWTTSLNLQVQGSAQALFSTQALALANSILGTNQNLIPQAVTVASWREL